MSDLFRRMPRWTTGRPVLLWLTLALVPALSLTAFVTAAHRDHQRALSRDWDARGLAALGNGQPALAVDAFRNALRFSRDDRDLRLQLAEALAAAGRGAEARAYLLNLWQDQPGSGRVNLQLARLAALQGDSATASRYYHNAIEGAWGGSAEERRRTARFELAEYLIGDGALETAEVEMLALAADQPPDLESRLRLASLLAKAGVHRRALGIYDEILADEPAERAALTGAAGAAMALGNHQAVVRYLGRIPRPQLDAATSEMLQVSTLVLELDPYRRGLRAVDRASRALRGLTAAADRLRQCTAQVPDLLPLQHEVAAALKTERRAALARDPDRMEAVVNLFFRAERAAEGRCAPAAAIDRALLLLAAQTAEGNP